MGIGLICGCFIFLKLIKYCLEHFFAQTYYSILGFVLGSILIIYPGLPLNFTGITCVLSFLCCFKISTIIDKT